MYKGPVLMGCDLEVFNRSFILFRVVLTTQLMLLSLFSERLRYVSFLPVDPKFQISRQPPILVRRWAIRLRHGVAGETSS